MYHKLHSVLNCVPLLCFTALSNEHTCPCKTVEVYYDTGVKEHLVYDRKAFFYFGRNRNSPKQPFFISAETDTENIFLFRPKPIPKPKQIFIAFSAISGVIFFKEVGFPTKIYSNHTTFVFWDCFGVIFVGNITSLKNITPEIAEKTVKICFG